MKPTLTLSEQIASTSKFLKERGVGEVEIGIVLGTGLNKLVDHIKDKQEINYSDIPGFPKATMEFHKGKLVHGRLEGKQVVIMQGRFHYYEGHSMQEITFPIRVLKDLDISQLLISNVSGGINLDFNKGDLVLIEDHINMQSDNPLRGVNYDELGPRFPDMSEPYSKAINKIVTEAAIEKDITLRKGVYVAVDGPNLETRAEYRMLKTVGADVVGMSTVPEVIVANHMGLPCAAVSVVTDICDPDNLIPISIEEIIAIAGESELKLIALFRNVISKLG